MKEILLATAILATLGLNGCNNDDDELYEYGEKVVIVKQKTISCDEPLTFKAFSEYESNASVEYGEDGIVSFGNEFGMDLSYTVIAECPEAETNETVAPLLPVDGVCPTGFELANDCATVCTPIKEVAVTCGEGTELDEETNICTVIPPVVCGEGLVWNEETELCDVIPEPEPLECVEDFTELNGACMPNRYIPSEGECTDGYNYIDRNNVCRIERS